MAKRLFVLASAAILVAGLSSTADAGSRGKLTINHKVLPVDQQRLLYDPPMAHLNAQDFGPRADTTWFGGVDGNGLAVQGGTWTFEDNTLQGWVSVDKTVQGDYFRRVVAADFASSDASGAIGDGTGSLWVGAFDPEADALCWPGGMGYDNGWGLDARKTFTYGGTDVVTVSFDYFSDSETQFDYTYVYTDVGGTPSLPLNTSAWSTPEGWGYSGAVEEGTAIGEPSNPASDSIEIQLEDLPDAAGPFDIYFNFQSDPLYSDGLDSFSGFLNSLYGPFGVDNVNVQGIGLSDLSTFTGGLDGWFFTAEAEITKLLQVAPITGLDPIGDPCTCPITTWVSDDGLDTSNDFVMVASDWDNQLGGFPHPKRQRELLISPPAYVGAGSGVENNADRLFIWDVWEDTPTSNGVGYRAVMSYYPWTCPETDVVSWTLEPAGDGGFIFSGLGGARCATLIVNNSEFIPAAIDSLKIVYELLGDCDDFGTADCTGPEQTNQSPYWDNIRLGLAGLDVSAPIIGLDLTYTDVFPAANSLLPNETADVHTWYDNNRADDDVTNANMGDSAVVIAGTDPGTEVYLNFRITPGPSLDVNDPEFDRYGPDASLAPSWAKARMDTAEVATGILDGSYSTYDWPGGQESGAKIIPDDFLTPGSLVEYFFSSNFSATPGDQDISPDTTGAFYLEFEVLPGYNLISADIAASCVLYVDAFNIGGQVPIEEWGLRPYLGTSTNDGGATIDNWDRYDYSAASSNVPAPLAREAAGDNGMTKYQSLIYQTILYNTGSFAQEGLRDGDADLLQTWLTTNNFDRWDIEKGLWLSGNGIASILDRDGRTDNNNLLAQFVQATVVSDGDAYRDITGDSTVCVRLDATSPRDFPASGVSYAAVRGNGCPNLLDFQVVSPIGDAEGNLQYSDQDAGGSVTQYASVSNEQVPGGSPSNPANYRVVLDAFSLHYMRLTPDGWTGEDCGTDSAAITTRVNDVFAWMGVSSALCDTSGLVIGVDEAVPGAVATKLFNNTPNPFNPRTTVRYQLGADAHVKLRIYDVNGRLVRTLVDGAQVAQQYNITWDGVTDAGKSVSSGVYWARLSTSTGFTASTKMVVLK